MFLHLWFAYKPTGSTTAAFNCCHASRNTNLESCSYVLCVLVDYSKAFDTINHSILFSKLGKLSLSGNILGWIYNFLTGRKQAVVANGHVSQSVKALYKDLDLDRIMRQILSLFIHTTSSSSMLMTLRCWLLSIVQWILLSNSKICNTGQKIIS